VSRKMRFPSLQSWLFHVAEVDNTAPAGSKEGGTVRTALTLLEGAPHEKLRRA
jgi:hypothetical protein